MISKGNFSAKKHSYSSLIWVTPIIFFKKKSAAIQLLSMTHSKRKVVSIICRILFNFKLNETIVTLSRIFLFFILNKIIHIHLNVWVRIKPQEISVPTSNKVFSDSIRWKRNGRNKKKCFISSKITISRQNLT